MQVKSIKQNYNQNDMSFKGISVGRSVPDKIVETIADSNNLREIAKKYELMFCNFNHSKFYDMDYLHLLIAKLRPAESPKTLLGRVFSALKAKTVGKTYDEIIIRDKSPIEAQIRQLSEENIESFIARQDFEYNLSHKIATAKTRKDNLRKIAQM